MQSLYAHYDTAHPTETGNATDSKKFVCDLCEKTYVSKQALVNHMKFVHSADSDQHKHVCQVCEKSFSKGYSLVHHMKFAHNADSDQHKVVCGACGQKFTTMFGLKQHTARAHGKEAAEKIRSYVRPGRKNNQRAQVCVRHLRQGIHVEALSQAAFEFSAFSLWLAILRM